MFSEAELAEAVAWRHDFHRHPELAFEEVRTSRKISQLLSGWGWSVYGGLARTGVVARLGQGPGIALRADMDALPINEVSTFEHRSTIPGRMHACGHDGHVAMLLLAARRLAEIDWKDRSITLIFQPAEENEGGARAMVREGLFKKFPCEAVYAIHNWPGLDVGKLVANDDRMMAAFSLFRVVLTGQSCHAAMPNQGSDVLAAAGRLVAMLQEVPTRRLSPHESAVVSITQLHGGQAFNVCPDRAELVGTLRWFGEEGRGLLTQALEEVSNGVALAHGCEAAIHFENSYPATINSAIHARLVCSIAEKTGLQPIQAPPSMASEDFSFMLNELPGAYIWLGAAKSDQNPMLHAPNFDFNDSVLAQGAELWVRLATQL
ncbi:MULTISPECIES: amidohydrolase [unclassified Roseivivax]|uniref:amidohydrolase n=1 Tax=unclassified Roseivivax TaxID=2639302 RepID=UPI001267AAB5|nr:MULTISPECIES: amidohydrolase [unclassified Roseivivax]QFT48943.1 putative hydrolase YxeP [Roseivivax sp. THAF40]QFT65097.1 putative hydrolase YxeP [Roseivivax sp. THAF30]